MFAPSLWYQQLREKIPVYEGTTYIKYPVIAYISILSFHQTWKLTTFMIKKWLNFYFEMFYHIQYTRNTYWCSAAVVLNFWLLNYLEMLPWIKVPSDIPAVLCKGCRMWWISKCFNISPIKYVMIKNWRYRMNHDCVNIATTSISQTLSSSMRHL